MQPKGRVKLISSHDGMIETFGGLLLRIGLFTRSVAFVLSGKMAVAYFKFHAPQGFWPPLHDGEGALLYCFIFLFLASAGGALIAGCGNVHQRSS